MGGFGARTLLIAAGAVSMGIGAGFERSLQDAWKTAALPQSAAMAMPAPSAAPRAAPSLASHSVAPKRPLALLATQAPARIDVAATGAPATPHPTTKRAAQRDSFVVKDVAIATAAPIAAAKDDRPTDVAPDVSDVQSAPIDAVAVQAPVTPTPSPTPTPTPTPQTKKRWIHRQLDHLNPFKPASRTNSPAPANPQGR